MYKESNAYDLTLFEDRTSPIKEIKTASGQKKKPKIKASPAKLIASCMLVVAISLAFIYSQTQLTVLSAGISDANKQLQELQNDQTRLEIQIEKKMNSQNLEEYAVSQLGLTKPQQYQIKYVKLRDSNTIQAAEKTEKGLLDKIKEAIANFMEYLKG